MCILTSVKTTILAPTMVYLYWSTTSLTNDWFDKDKVQTLVAVVSHFTKLNSMQTHHQLTTGVVAETKERLN